MKAARILLIGRELLKLMSICDLKIDDYKYLEMYSEYVKARNSKVKYSAIIMELSDKYGISESSVKRIIRRFEREI